LDVFLETILFDGRINQFDLCGHLFLGNVLGSQNFPDVLELVIQKNGIFLTYHFVHC